MRLYQGEIWKEMSKSPYTSPSAIHMKSYLTTFQDSFLVMLKKHGTETIDLLVDKFLLCVTMIATEYVKVLSSKIGTPGVRAVARCGINKYVEVGGI